MKLEFSRNVIIDELSLNKKFETKANDSELISLSKRFNLHSIKFLKLTYIISEKDDIKRAYLLDCNLQAEVVKFVVEGNEEELTLDEQFDVVLADEESIKQYEDILKDNDIEIINAEEPCIDVGEIAAQYLSLYVYM